MVQKRLLFILNPISGKGKAAKSATLIRHICGQMDVYCDLRDTSSPGDACRIAREGLSENFDVIVAVGGDGTVNEVGRELVGTKMSLGIVPTGSGNGLARHLKIPLEVDAAVRRIIMGKTLLMDVGQLDGNVFLNVAGIGFDAQVSNAFAKSLRRGWYNYLRIILGLAAKFRGIEITMKSAEQRTEGKFMMLSFANSSQFGNNAIIAPSADIADGKLDICMLKPISFPIAMYFLLKLLTGTVRKTSYFDSYQSAEAEVSGSGGLAHVDGEAVKVKDIFSVRLLPSSLNVIC